MGEFRKVKSQLYTCVLDFEVESSSLVVVACNARIIVFGFIYVLNFLGMTDPHDQLAIHFILWVLKTAESNLDSN